ncbi:hypothetical protein GP486_000425 [Trichoglossum hirsutum]|uniref:Uncharacterized protein n=1 Tax=Trichoglossum hirsutum TaxID=265104 RepID=A0A9P8LIX2_9PEZI|nr:hypothetical protein GP486_000425 [Trichoglossum hirsutum]
MRCLTAERFGRCIFYLGPLLQLAPGSHAHPHIRRQNNAQGQTTIAGSDCASPSCTVTLDVIPTIKATPSPATIRPNGANAAVVVTFSPITTTSVRPGTTVLRNTDTAATLTLGSVTLSPLTVTATASYVVSPSETPVVEVVAVVKPEAQMYIKASNDSGTCPVDSPPTDNSHPKRGSLVERTYRILNCNPGQAAKVNAWVNDAIIVLQTVNQRLTTDNDQEPVRWVGEQSFSTYFEQRWFPRMRPMANAILSVLQNNPHLHHFICQGQSGPSSDECRETSTFIPFAATTDSGLVDCNSLTANTYVFGKEYYGRQFASALTSQYQIYNADTWAWYFLDRKITSLVG